MIIYMYVYIIVGDGVLDVPLEAIWFGLFRICVEQHCADNTNEIADKTSRGRAVEGASPYI